MPFRSRFVLYVILYGGWVLLLFTLTGGLRDLTAWLASWQRWDALLYERLWSNGYQISDQKLYAFPPGYSLLAGGLSRLTSIDFFQAGMLLNIAAFFGYAVVAAELLTRRMAIPPLALFAIILTSPTAYFIFPAYSDSLYAAMLWSTLYLALFKPSGIGYRGAEFLLLLAAPWVRLTGYALAVWVVFRRYSVAAVFISLGGWLWLNTVTSEDAFHFLHVQSFFGGMKQGNLLDGILYSFNLFPANLPSGAMRSWRVYLQWHALPCAYFLAIAASAIWFCRRGQWLMGVTALAVLLFSHNQYYWRSALRYDLPLLPFLYTPLLEKSATPGKAYAKGVICGALGATQFILQVYFADLFRANAWAF